MASVDVVLAESELQDVLRRINRFVANDALPLSSRQKIAGSMSVKGRTVVVTMPNATVFALTMRDGAKAPYMVGDVTLTKRDS